MNETGVLPTLEQLIVERPRQTTESFQRPKGGTMRVTGYGREMPLPQVVWGHLMDGWELIRQSAKKCFREEEQCVRPQHPGGTPEG